MQDHVSLGNCRIDFSGVLQDLVKEEVINNEVTIALHQHDKPTREGRIGFSVQLVFVSTDDGPQMR